MTKGFRVCLSVLLTVVLLASMSLAETNPSAMMRARDASVNGSAVRGSAAVFSGDSIQTSASGAATLASNGSTVLLPANTKLVVGKNSVDLQSGTAMVNTTTGMNMRTLAYVISPANRGTAKFAVTNVNGRVVVAAEHGALMIANGSTKMLVPEGKSETLDNAPQGPAPAAAAAGGGLSKTALIAIGAAAAATGGIIAYVSSGSPSSPSAR